MPKYLIEFTYFGKNYHGFQKQINANSVEEEIEKALSIIFREEIDIIGSSRTDAGVHALGNTAHFEVKHPFTQQHLYNVNSILPQDISIDKAYLVSPDFHSRFDALYRDYTYKIIQTKKPFEVDRAFFYPFPVPVDKLFETQRIILHQENFMSFCKSHSDVKTYNCKILLNEWTFDKNTLIYKVRGDRFLRGMVRALVATQLAYARSKISLLQFQELFLRPSLGKAFFNADGKGLVLEKVYYEPSVLQEIS